MSHESKVTSSDSSSLAPVLAASFGWNLFGNSIEGTEGFEGQESNTIVDSEFGGQWPLLHEGFPVS